jgi:hypothetical protein
MGMTPVLIQKESGTAVSVRRLRSSNTVGPAPSNVPPQSGVVPEE